MKDMDLWLVERRVQTNRELKEMELQELFREETPARTLNELLKLDFLLLELERSIGLMDGVKI